MNTCRAFVSAIGIEATNLYRLADFVNKVFIIFAVHGIGAGIRSIYISDRKHLSLGAPTVSSGTRASERIGGDFEFYDEFVEALFKPNKGALLRSSNRKT